MQYFSNCYKGFCHLVFKKIIQCFIPLNSYDSFWFSLYFHEKLLQEGHKKMPVAETDRFPASVVAQATGRLAQSSCTPETTV